jgi:hypothetical protein
MNGDSRNIEMKMKNPSDWKRVIWAGQGKPIGGLEDSAGGYDTI